MEEVVQKVMKVMLSGESVRIGYQGVFPIFSLSQAINLASGLDASNSFGRNFINCTMKSKHPELYEQIIHHQFPLSAHKAPCMSFSNLLNTLALVKSSFSSRLHEIATAGILRTEAGDQSLVEYILRNAASDSAYHKLVRQILYAEKHPDLALQGIGPVNDHIPETQNNYTGQKPNTGEHANDNITCDEMPSDDGAEIQFQAPMSGQKHFMDFPEYPTLKKTKPQETSLSVVPAFYYDVYNHNVKDSRHFYEDLVRKDDTERKDRNKKDEQYRQDMVHKDEQYRADMIKIQEQHRADMIKIQEQHRAEIIQKDEQHRADMLQKTELGSVQIQELKDEKAELKAEKKELKTKLKETEKLKDKNTILLVNNEILKKKLSSIEQDHKDENKEELIEMKIELEMKRKEMEELQNKNTTLLSQKATLISENHTLETRISSAKQYREEIDYLNGKCKLLNSEIQEQKTTISRLRNQIDDMERVIRMLKPDVITFAR